MQTIKKEAMPTIIKPESLEYKIDPKALKEFGLKTLFPRLGTTAASTHFSFDIRQLDPDMYSFPYHFHRNSEEMMMIISGSMTVRMPDSITVLKQGDLIFFEIGETGAHQFYNHDTIPCTYLDIRSTIGIDISEYPDSGKINILPFREIFEKSTQVTYNHGEDNVRKIWDDLRNI
jgi:uncharacterized cupin superfamily protein